MEATKVSLEDWTFDVDTPRFLKEAAENCNGGMYAICWNIFQTLLGEVAVRATEINDPVLNFLMLKLNLYDCSELKISRREAMKLCKEEYQKQFTNF